VRTREAVTTTVSHVEGFAPVKVWLARRSRRGVVGQQRAQGGPHEGAVDRHQLAGAVLEPERVEPARPVQHHEAAAVRLAVRTVPDQLHLDRQRGTRVGHPGERLGANRRIAVDQAVRRGEQQRGSGVGQPPLVFTVALSVGQGDPQPAHRLDDRVEPRPDLRVTGMLDGPVRGRGRGRGADQPLERLPVQAQPPGLLVALEPRHCADSGVLTVNVSASARSPGTIAA
jgi:hypothetical protein